jgi:hypothetical protein
VARGGESIGAPPKSAIAGRGLQRFFVCCLLDLSESCECGFSFGGF